MGEEDKTDRGSGGKTTSEDVQAWSSPSPRGQWRTREKWRKVVAKSSVVSPTTLAVKGWMMMMMNVEHETDLNLPFDFDLCFQNLSMCRLFAHARSLKAINNSCETSNACT